jgi:hypothetical protein
MSKRLDFVYVAKGATGLHLGIISWLGARVSPPQFVSTHSSLADIQFDHRGQKIAVSADEPLAQLLRSHPALFAQV